MSYPGQEYNIPNPSHHYPQQPQHQQQYQQQPQYHRNPSPSPGYRSPPPPLSPVPQFPQPQSPYYATPSRSPGHSPLPYPSSTPPPPPPRQPTISFTTETPYATRDLPGSYFAPQYVPSPQPMYHANSPVLSPVVTNPTTYLDLPPPPPSRAQSFDVPGGRHEHFQYSQCNGKRKALLVGINYFGTPNELKGCINDVRNIAPFLNQRYGFAYDDMVILTDDQTTPSSRPTRENIIRAMKWLVNGAQPNDSLFFHFSGHGGQTEDLDGDEDDGLDETIYPVDFKKAGMIVDDEMHDIMVKPLPAGCRLTSIFDCCHSGSMLDLPYEYGSNGQLKDNCVYHDAAKGLLNAGQAYARGDTSGLVQAGMSLFHRVTRTKEQRERTRVLKTAPADVIQFSGCKDDQKSADTTEAGQATGAMSWAFRQVLTAKPKLSYKDLLSSIRELLATKYQQKPVLSASHPIDTKLLFVL